MLNLVLLGLHRFKLSIPAGLNRFKPLAWQKQVSAGRKPTLSLVTLTFDLSTSKSGNRSSPSWSSFLPAFSTKDQSREKQTDSDAHQRLVPHITGAAVA